jgi:hypothetical protein
MSRPLSGERSSRSLDDRRAPRYIRQAGQSRPANYAYSATSSHKNGRIRVRKTGATSLSVSPLPPQA